MMRWRAAILAIVVSACALLCGRTAAAPYSVKDYQHRLERCAAAARDAHWKRGRSNDLPAACSILKYRSLISNQNKSYFADPRYLLSMKKSLESSPCGKRDCPDPGAALAARVRHFSRALPGLAGSARAAGFGAFNGRLKTILKRREFRNPEPLLSRLIPDKIKEWFRNLLERLGRGFPRAAGPLGGALKALVVMLGVFAVFVIGYIIYLTAGEGGGARGGAEHLAATGEETLSPSQIRERADTQARAGNFRDAARLLFLALIRSVEESGIVRFLATKTNREFMAELSRTRAVSPELQSLNHMFEEIWYGMRPCSQIDYQRFEGLYQNCRKQLS